jgi:hypothetical protein
MSFCLLITIFISFLSFLRDLDCSQRFESSFGCRGRCHPLEAIFFVDLRLVELLGLWCLLVGVGPIKRLHYFSLKRDFYN